MKKAAILTICNNGGPTNYGQILQCYAMQYLVRSWGYEPLIIQYRKKKKNDMSRRHHSNRTFIGRYLNERYERRYHIEVVEKGETERTRKFSQFIQEYIHLSAPCYTKKMVEEMTRDCELLICGSDQIWNPAGFDPIFFLDFGNKEQKRIAYAVSGIFTDNETLSKTYCEMSSLIERLSQVSVRERIGQQILQKYTRKEISVTPDPTRSIPAEEWNKIAASRLVEEDYIFCYLLGNLRPWQLVLRKLRKKYSAVKIIYIPTNIENSEGFSLAEPYESAGPAEFISLIRYAKAVLTDSFHGTVFSVLYQRPFYNVKQHRTKARKYWGSERIENLLEELGMDSRFVGCVKDVDKL